MSASWRRARTGTLLTGLLLAVLIAVVAAPLATLLGRLLPMDAEQAQQLRLLLIDDDLRSAFVHSLAVALLACLLASAIAIPAAFVALRAGRLTRWIVVACAFLALVTPGFVTTAVLRELAADGWSGPWSLLVAGLALHGFPLILFSLLAGLAAIDRSLEEAALNLGAGRLTLWRRVLLPLAMPSYLAGLGLMLLRCLGDAATPLVLRIDDLLAPRLLGLARQAGAGQETLATALALFLLCTLVSVMLWQALTPRHDLAFACGPARPARWPRRNAAWLSALPLVLLVPITLGPLSWLVGLALAGTATDAPGDPVTVADGTTATTLAYLTAAGLATLLLAAPAGYTLLSFRSPRPLLRFAVGAQLAVPALLLAAVYRGLVDGAAAAWIGLVVVVAVQQLPLLQRIIAQRLAMSRGDSLATAHNLGVGGIAGYLRFGLPSLAATFAALALFGAAGALAELSAALLLLDGPILPYPLTVFAVIRSAPPVAWAPHALLLVVASGLVTAAAVAAARRRGERRRSTVNLPVPLPGAWQRGDA